MDTYTVEFRIETSTLSASEVTEVLGLIPSQTSDTNTLNKNRKPFWSYDGISTEANYISKEWESLEEGLLFLLEKLLPKRDLIQSHYGEYKKYLWCGFFQDSYNGGPTFSPLVLNKLADFNVELILKTYHNIDVKR